MISRRRLAILGFVLLGWLAVPAVADECCKKDYDPIEDTHDYFCACGNSEVGYKTCSYVKWVTNSSLDCTDDCAGIGGTHVDCQYAEGQCLQYISYTAISCDGATEIYCLGCPPVAHCNSASTGTECDGCCLT